MTSSTSISTGTASWKILLTLDVKSDDFTHSARRLLSDQREGKSEFPQLTEEEGFKLIELIEPTILQHPNIAPHLKSTAFTVLRRLCGIFEKLPRSCSINQDFKTQEEIPFATRGYTDLWERNWNGRKVAVKTLRFGPDDDKGKIKRRFCKEVVVWKRLNHPNILPFHGASMFNPNKFCMVSPWMENGNVLSYTRKNPEANRLRLLVDVASGLKFLHRMSLVHGNIRGSNILISDSQPPRALLGDFGLNTIIFDPFSLTRASINWTAPELLTPDDNPYQPSISSDIYSLGMVIYEVLTGTPPFVGKGKTELACKVALEGERPQRPRDSEKLGFTNKVWEVLQRCWEKKPSARPPIDKVSACLKHAAETWVVDVPAFMLASEAGVEQVMNMREDQAKDFANKLDETLNQVGIGGSGKVYLSCLQKLCGASGVLPGSFMLIDGFDDIEAQPFTSGGFADLYRATYKGQQVVAKTLKTAYVDDPNSESVHKRFVNEVVGWKWLKHDNILPFVGVSSIPLPFSMVSAWMENGDVISFMRATPNHNPFSLLMDATNGLQYLHQRDFVHGDIKGANILINSKLRACLADFGLAAVADPSSVDRSSSYKAGGTVRWMAPEILDPERYGYVNRAQRKLPSKGTDIYALGMTILEVITGQIPFEHTNKDDVVAKKVLSGTRPDRPFEGFSDALWKLLTRTWLEEFECNGLASVRPNTTNILEQLQDEEKGWSPTSVPFPSSIQMERKASAASSLESSGFLGQLVDDMGDDSEDASFHHEVDFEDILNNIDQVPSPEPADDDWDILNPESPTCLSSRNPYFPPQAPPASPRAKTSGVRKAWSKSKQLFMKKFGRRRALPKLSDKLVPEQDEVKWYEALFSKPAKSTSTRKYAYFTVDA